MGDVHSAVSRYGSVGQSRASARSTGRALPWTDFIPCARPCVGQKVLETREGSGNRSLWKSFDNNYRPSKVFCTVINILGRADVTATDSSRGGTIMVRI